VFVVPSMLTTFIYPKDGGGILLRNAFDHKPDHAISHHALLCDSLFFIPPVFFILNQFYDLLFKSFWLIFYLIIGSLFQINLFLSVSPLSLSSE
jgi:hypothetical protein